MTGVANNTAQDIAKYKMILDHGHTHAAARFGTAPECQEVNGDNPLSNGTGARKRRSRKRRDGDVYPQRIRTNARAAPASAASARSAIPGAALP